MIGGIARATRSPHIVLFAAHTVSAIMYDGGLRAGLLNASTDVVGGAAPAAVVGSDAAWRQHVAGASAVEAAACSDLEPGGTRSNPVHSHIPPSQYAETTACLVQRGRAPTVLHQ